MKKPLIPVIIMTIALGILLAIGCNDGSTYDKNSSAPDLTRINGFEGGTLYKTKGDGGSGTFYVLDLKGTWREMGRQYGRLLKKPMGDFYETVVTKRLINEQGLKLSEIDEASDEIYKEQSSYVKELIAGMAETSGNSIEKQKTICALVQLADLSSGCSSLAVWDDYTGGKPLIVGRNWDIGGPYADYRKFIAVVVYNPTGEKRGVADINFMGTISMQTGMTEDGLFLDLQNGQRSDPAIVDGRRMPTFALFDFLLNSSSLSDLEKKLMDPANLPQLSLIINVADANEDRVYEWATYNVKQRTGNGLIASSNHFLNPAWENLPFVPAGAEGDYSNERVANLLALGELNKGNIDPELMMAIFDTPYENGGATFDPYTVYQVVAVPAEKTIWVKTLSYSGWEKVDLRPLFKN